MPLVHIAAWMSGLPYPSRDRFCPAVGILGFGVLPERLRQPTDTLQRRAYTGV